MAGRRSALPTLELTAHYLITKNGYVTRGELSKVAGFVESTVRKYWQAIAENLSADITTRRSVYIDRMVTALTYSEVMKPKLDQVDWNVVIESSPV